MASEPMELETTPPLRRQQWCVIVPEHEYKPCANRAEAEYNLKQCKEHAVKNVRFMNQKQMQTALLEILDAQDELSLFESAQALSK